MAQCGKGAVPHTLGRRLRTRWHKLSAGGDACVANWLAVAALCIYRGERVRVADVRCRAENEIRPRSGDAETISLA